MRAGIRVAASLLLVGALTVGCGGHVTPVAPSADTKEVAPVFVLTSPAFSAEQPIPNRFAKSGAPGGANTSIPYEWSGSPQTTRSFALVLVDRAPAAHNWVHWAVVDIPATAASIAEGASGSSAMPAGALELANTFGSSSYGGPLPPVGSGRHAYEATLYALDTSRLDVSGRVSAATLERAVQGHVLATATLVGYFER